MTTVTSPSEIGEWLRAGYNYEQIVKLYHRRGVATSVATISRIASEHGLILGSSLYIHGWILFEVEPEHVETEMFRAIRHLLRARGGESLTATEQRELSEWDLKRSGRVVDYDPESGWSFVARRPGVDNDWFRVPG